MATEANKQVLAVANLLGDADDAGTGASDGSCRRGRFLLSLTRPLG